MFSILQVGKGDLSSDVPAKDFKTSFDLSQVVVQLMYLRKKVICLLLCVVFCCCCCSS